MKRLLISVLNSKNNLLYRGNVRVSIHETILVWYLTFYIVIIIFINYIINKSIIFIPLKLFPD